MDSNELPPLMSREEFLDHENLPPKLLALNNWLLDGNLGSNSKPDYRAYKKEHVVNGAYFKADPLNQGIGAPNRTTITELARTSVAMVDEQIFLDGNTRTAVLVLLEYLASVGILYTRDPIRIYWILAQREPEDDKYEPKSAVRDVVKEVGDSNYRPDGGVTDQQRQQYAQQVKDTKTVWKKITAINERVQNVPLGAEKRRIVQEEKQKDPYLYGLYVEAMHIT